MKILGFNISRKSFTPSVHPVQSGDNWMYMIGSSGWQSTGSVDCNTVQGQRDAYLRCPVLATVILQKNLAANNGKIAWIDDKDQPATNPITEKYEAVLRNPNTMQDWPSFNALMRTMKDIHGRAYIWMIKPIGFGDVKEMQVLINTDVTEVYAGGKLSYYNVSFNNVYQKIMPEDVMVWSDQYFNLKDTNNLIQGGSRLRAIQDPINIIIAAYEAQEHLLTNAGAIGILSNQTTNTGGSIPIKPDEKSKIEAQYMGNYGLQKDKSPVLITNANLRWQSMTKNVADLMLIESVEAASREICNIMGFPPMLLGLTDATYNNVREAKESLYENTIMPESESFADIYTHYTGLDKKKIWLTFDYSSLSVLQESEQERAAATKTTADTFSLLYKDGVVTLQEYREAIGMPEQINGSTFYQNPQNNETQPTN